MDKKTLNALKASIKHWEENRDAEDFERINISADACALCDIFNRARGCYNCPVYNRTGRYHCSRSPWMRVNLAFAELHVRGLNDSIVHQRFKEACQKEIDFLKSLLPTKEK